MGVSYGLYLATTADEWELPLCVGTAREVANYLGVSRATLYREICRPREGLKRGYRVYKIEEDEE